MMRLSENAAEPFGSLIQPWQAADFAALDPAWLSLAGHDVQTSVRRAWIERPRGHGKTADMALQLAWILSYSRHRIEGLAAAADRDQGTLIRDALLRLSLANPEWFPSLKFCRHWVEHKETGSRLTIISSDVSSSYGALPDFVICDELCHWEKPDLWHSLVSSAAKRPKCVLAVLTNAGVGQGWQWQLREAARRNAESQQPTWHFSSLDGVQAPWLDPRHLEEQRALLPKEVFERLWLNRWQQSDGGFITLAEAEACRDDGLNYQTVGEGDRQYLAAVDYAEKHDLTVGVVVHRELFDDGFRIVIDRMDVVAPSRDQPTRVDWVDEWIQRILAGFPHVRFVLDEYQLVGVIQQWETQADVTRFPFRGGIGNHRLATTLRKLILHRELAWYPECGQRTDTHTRDDLETELASLLLKQKSDGHIRIDHRTDGRHHDDRSFALGAACLHLLDDESPPEFLRFDGFIA